MHLPVCCFPERPGVPFAGSHTARFICSWRASAHALGFGPDHLAQLFLDDCALRRLAPAAERFRCTGDLPVVVRAGSRDAVIALQVSRPGDEIDMLSFVQVRTCFFDDVVLRFAADFCATGAGTACATGSVADPGDIPPAPALKPDTYGSSSLAHGPGCQQPTLSTSASEIAAAAAFVSAPSIPRFEASAAWQCSVVLLGAGFDARFYRLNLPRGIRLWEFDAPDTQRFKRAVLESPPGRAAMSQHGRYHDVTFAPLDLSSGPALAHQAEHYQWFGRPMLFVCEGVLPYLDIGAVQALLRQVGLFDGPAAIAFDTVTRAFRAHQPVREGLARAHEPWLSNADSAIVANLCDAAGLHIIDELSVLQGLERYLPTSAAGSVGFGSAEIRMFVAANPRFVSAAEAAGSAVAAPS